MDSLKPDATVKSSYQPWTPPTKSDEEFARIVNDQEAYRAKLKALKGT